MKVSERSFPHPVLGNGDDVPKAAFQATLEMEIDGVFAHIDVKTTCSSKTIKKLIVAGKATHILHVECSNTMYRRSFRFSESEKRVSVELSNLNDDVEVNCFVCATGTIEKYKIEGMHEDYGKATFPVTKGDVLAIGEGRVFPVESKFDSSKRIGSIMQIQQASEKGDQPMRVDFENNKINIYLSQPDFSAYKELKINETLLVPMTVAITLPVLAEAIGMINDEQAANQYENFRWYHCLQRRIESEGLGNEPDALVKAQRLLELPLNRALDASTKFMTDSSA